MLPNFLIVGAHKSASTSLYHYAREHPQVFMPAVKEPRFFIADYIRGVEWDHPMRSRLTAEVTLTEEAYRALFAGIRDETAVGEASPQYLYFHEMAIPGIRRLLGQPRIAMILRDPVVRAHSAYNLLRRRGFVDLDLDTFIDREAEYVEKRHPPAFHVIRMGFYAAQVRAYRAAFPDVRVMFQHDLDRDPQGVIRGFYEWLGVDADFRPDLETRHNIGADKTALAPETARRLRRLYRDDILTLQADLGVDLSAWLE